MRIVILSMALLITLQANAQQARVKRYTAPLAGQVVLKDVEDKYNAQVFSIESPSPDGNADKLKLQAIKKEIAEKYPPRKVSNSKAKTTQAASPVVLGSFVADSLAGIPPDNDMAISNGHRAISVMNSSIAVLDGTNGQMLSKKNLKTFSGAVNLGGLNTNHYRYDPKIIYDPEADKFICVMLNGTNEYNWIVFGFSHTNDPEGAWNFYKLYGDYAADTTWFDYPAIAITHDELFLTGNKLVYDGSWQTGFRQSVIYQVRKADGYNGATDLNYQIWDSIAMNNGIYIRNLFPAKGGAAIYGPEQYFVSNRNFDVQNDTILLVKIPDTIGSSNTNLTVTVLQSNLSYGVPPDGRQDTTYNPGLSKLTTNDGRILGAYIENDEIQFVSASLNTSTGSSAVYHGKISSVSTTPAVTAQMFTVDTLDFGYPNISYAGNQGDNTSIISFDYTGPHTFAGLGAIYYDGSQFSDLIKVKQGDSIIKVMQGLHRWGDYTGSQTSWNSIGRVWIVGIYGRKDRKYGNYMAEIGVPALAGVQHTQNMKQGGNIYPNPAWQFVQVEFSVPSEQLVDFAIYDMQGKLVDKIVNNRCKKGKNLIQFNVAPLSVGNYILRGVNDKGVEVVSDKFVRQ